MFVIRIQTAASALQLGGSVVWVGKKSSQWKGYEQNFKV